MEFRVWFITAVLFTAEPAGAAVFTWQTPGSGSWFDAPNWLDDGAPPANGVPERLDDAVIANGGTAQVSAAATLLTEVEIFDLFVGAASTGTADGTVDVDGVDFSVLSALDIGTLSGTATAASGQATVAGGDLDIGGSVRIGTVSNPASAGTAVSASLETDTLAVGFTTVGSAVSGLGAALDAMLRTGGDAAFRASTTIGSITDGTGDDVGATVEIGGNASISSAFNDVGRINSGTGTIDATFDVDGTLTFDDAGFGLGLNLGDPGSSITARSSVGSVAGGADPADDISIAIASGGGSVSAAFSAAGGDLPVAGDVTVGQVFTDNDGTATGTFESGGRLLATGASGLHVGRALGTLLGTLGPAGAGDAVGEISALGLSGFSTINIGNASANLSQDQTAEGTAVVGTGGIVAGPAVDTNLNIGVAFGSPNNNQVFGVGAVATGSLETSGDIDLGEGQLNIGTSTNAGDASGMVAVNGAHVSAGSVSIGVAVLNGGLIVPDGVRSAVGELIITNGSLTQEISGFGFGSVRVGTALDDATVSGVLRLENSPLTADNLFIGQPLFPTTTSVGDGLVEVTNAPVTIADNVGVGGGNVIDSEINAVLRVTNATMSVGGDLFIGQADDALIELTDVDLTVGDRISIIGNSFSNLVAPRGELRAVNTTIEANELFVGASPGFAANAILNLEQSDVVVAGIFALGFSSNLNTLFDTPIAQLDAASSIDVGGLFRIEFGATTELHIAGVRRQQDYAAIDSQTTVLDGFLEATFDSQPLFSHFQYDLITTREDGGITDDFRGVTIDGLGMSGDVYVFSSAIVSDDLGTGPVDLYRLTIAPALAGTSGCTNNTPGSNESVTCNAFDDIGVSGLFGSDGVRLTVTADGELDTFISAVSLFSNSTVHNEGVVRARGPGVAAVAVLGDGAHIVNDNRIDGADNAGFGVVFVTDTGERATLENRANGWISTDAGIAIAGGDGEETVLNQGRIDAGGAMAVDLGAGDDSFQWDAGSAVTGTVSGGADNDTFVLGGTADDSFSFASGQVVGFESFVKSGAGRWNVVGEPTGDWHVQSGTLAFNGTTAGAFMIDPGATLAGTGVTGPITNSGTVAPGNSIGTLTVNGTYVHNAGAVLAVETEPTGAADRLDVTGSARLNGGEVAVAAGGAAYARRTRYTILSAAGGVTGAFASATVDRSDLDALLSYDGTNVLLDLILNRLELRGLGATFNERSVAIALEAGGLTATGDYGTVVDQLLQLEGRAAESALDSLSGELFATGQMFLADTADAFARRVRTHSRALALGTPTFIAYAPGGLIAAQPAATHDIWLEPFFAVGDYDGDGNAAGADYWRQGFAVGGNWALTPRLWLGAALGYSRGEIGSVRRNGGEVDADSFFFGISADVVMQRWRAELLGNFAIHEIDGERRLAVGALTRKLYSDTDGSAWALGATGFVEAWRTPSVRIEPFVGVRHHATETDGFTERGGGAALRVADADFDTTVVSLGVLTTATARELGGFAVTPQVSMSVAQELGDRRGEIDAAFAGDAVAPTPAFPVLGTRRSRTRGILDVDVGVSHGGGWSATLGYHGEYRSDTSDHQVSAGIAYRW